MYDNVAGGTTDSEMMPHQIVAYRDDDDVDYKQNLQRMKNQ